MPFPEQASGVRFSECDMRSIPEAPTLRPTKQEFERPMEFLARAFPLCRDYGIVRIVPPRGWRAPMSLDRRRFRFKSRYQAIHKLTQRDRWQRWRRLHPLRHRKQLRGLLRVTAEKHNVKLDDALSESETGENDEAEEGYTTRCVAEIGLSEVLPRKDFNFVRSVQRFLFCSPDTMPLASELEQPLLVRGRSLWRLWLDGLRRRKSEATKVTSRNSQQSEKQEAVWQRYLEPLYRTLSELDLSPEQMRSCNEHLQVKFGSGRTVDLVAHTRGYGQRRRVSTLNSRAGVAGETTVETSETTVEASKTTVEAGETIVEAGETIVEAGETTIEAGETSTEVSSLEASGAVEAGMPLHEIEPHWSTRDNALDAHIVDLNYDSDLSDLFSSSDESESESDSESESESEGESESDEGEFECKSGDSATKHGSSDGCVHCKSARGNLLQCEQCDCTWHRACLPHGIRAHVPDAESVGESGSSAGSVSGSNPPSHVFECETCRTRRLKPYGYQENDATEWTLHDFAEEAAAFSDAWLRRVRKWYDEPDKQWDEAAPHKWQRYPAPHEVTQQQQQPPVDAVETEYWRLVMSGLTRCYVEYGAEVAVDEGDAWPQHGRYATSPWNLNRIAQQAGSPLAHVNRQISGMTRPWTYVGMLFATFAWHTEDHYAPSINYIHEGAGKTWYGIPAYAAQRFENVAARLFRDTFRRQPAGEDALWFALVTQFSPVLLRRCGVPVFRIPRHNAGEFILTWPRGHHSGFNRGFNVATAVNLAINAWLPYSIASQYRMCVCKRAAAVSITALLLRMAEAPETTRDTRRTTRKAYPARTAALSAEAAAWLLAPLHRVIRDHLTLRRWLVSSEGPAHVVCARTRQASEAACDPTEDACDVCGDSLVLARVTCGGHSGDPGDHSDQSHSDDHMTVCLRHTGVMCCRRVRVEFRHSHAALLRLCRRVARVAAQSATVRETLGFASSALRDCAHDRRRLFPPLSLFEEATEPSGKNAFFNADLDEFLDDSAAALVDGFRRCEGGPKEYENAPTEACEFHAEFARRVRSKRLREVLTPLRQCVQQCDPEWPFHRSKRRRQLRMQTTTFDAVAGARRSRRQRNVSSALRRLVGCDKDSDNNSRNQSKNTTLLTLSELCELRDSVVSERLRDVSPEESYAVKRLCEVLQPLAARAAHGDDAAVFALGLPPATAVDCGN
ncbi:MAG: hypothetical protein MHM6MM_003376 [Cercozoa sp. M6MM]